MIQKLELQVKQEGEESGSKKITPWREFGLKVSRAMAHQVDASFDLPWLSFGEFFEDKTGLGGKGEFIVYCEENGVRKVVSYKQFGSLVNSTARYLKENLKVLGGGSV